jgi:GTPase SAR1 family protein
MLRIWDTAGQERFRALAPMYYQGTHAAIVVFSLVDAATLRDAETWLNEHLDELPRTWIIGNKADLDGERKVPLAVHMLEIAKSVFEGQEKPERRPGKLHKQ